MRTAELYLSSPQKEPATSLAFAAFLTPWSQDSACKNTLVPSLAGPRDVCILLFWAYRARGVSLLD